MNLFHLLRSASLILAAVLGLAGCQKPSIDGDFVSTRGGVTVTLKDGNFSDANGVFHGTYALSDNHDIVLTGATGAVYEGYMPDRDSIFINRERGQDSPGFSLSRVGTKAANETLAIHGAAKQAQNTPPDAFKPDPSVPLSAYTTLHTTTDAALVLIPWSGKPMADDDLLRNFAIGNNSSDSFKRQAFAQENLPKLHAQMDAAVQQRYYTIDINRNAERDSFVLINFSLSPYDLSSKTFSLSTVGHDCWKGHEINLNRMTLGYGFWIEQSDKPCRISVPDEATARQIEDLRARSMLQVSGTIGVCITHKGPGLGRVSVALTYAHLVLTATRGPAFQFETDL